MTRSKKHSLNLGSAGSSGSVLSVLRHSMLAAVLTAGLLYGYSLEAQSPAAPPDFAPAQSVTPKQPVRKHARKSAKPLHEATAPVVETRPPDPPPPNWPVNDHAKSASVDWNGRELSISASNSSLKQILHDISTATGLKVDGIGNDQKADARVYGVYGPAPARDVLSQLLDGAGYNVLMIGDQGQGAPRELLLSAKSAHGSAAQKSQGGIQQNQSQEEDAPEEPEQPEPPPPQPPNHPFGNSQNPQQPDQGRTPQQMLQDLQQQRIQQLQQQQQQQQSGQPPAYNPTPAPSPAPN